MANYPGGMVGKVPAFNAANVAHVERSNARKPTITHFRAADGTPWTITTRIVEGVMRVDVFEDTQSRKVAVMSGEFTAREG